MTVTIEPVAGRRVVELITTALGKTLDPKDSGILDFCQNMSSETWTGWVGEELICCWGLIPPTILSTQAYLWMHATPAVREHQFLLVRHSQKIIEQTLLRYPLITGHCLVSAKDSRRWLRWLGAVFAEPVGDFISFEIRRKAEVKQVANG